jgi:hypothetical protein
VFVASTFPGPLLALRVISVLGSKHVAFGEKRTLDGEQRLLAQSIMTHCGPVIVGTLSATMSAVAAWKLRAEALGI